MPDDEAPDVPQYGLVEKFVVCTSVGGPYDDEAYCAGIEYGELQARLTHGGPGKVIRAVRSAHVAQLDLLAMRLGYALKAEPWDEHPDEWTLVILTPIDDAP